MHEILKTEKLLKEHPEEFPESLQKGRMIERSITQNGNRPFHHSGVQTDF